MIIQCCEGPVLLLCVCSSKKDDHEIFLDFMLLTSPFFFLYFILHASFPSLDFFCIFLFWDCDWPLETSPGDKFLINQIKISSCWDSSFVQMNFQFTSTINVYKMVYFWWGWAGWLEKIMRWTLGMHGSNVCYFCFQERVWRLMLPSTYSFARASVSVKCVNSEDCPEPIFYFILFIFFWAYILIWLLLFIFTTWPYLVVT